MAAAFRVVNTERERPIRRSAGTPLALHRDMPARRLIEALQGFKKTLQGLFRALWGSHLWTLLWPDWCAACDELGEALFCAACALTLLPYPAGCPCCGVPLNKGIPR